MNGLIATVDCCLPSQLLRHWFHRGRSTLAVSDRELQLRLVQMLLGGHGPGSGSEPASPEESSYAPGNGGGQQQRSMQGGLKAEALPAALPHEQHDRYLTLLLQREVQRYAAQVCGCAFTGMSCPALRDCLGSRRCSIYNDSNTQRPHQDQCLPRKGAS